MNAKTIIETRDDGAAAAVYAAVHQGLIELAKATAEKTGRKCWVTKAESINLDDQSFGRNLVVKIGRDIVGRGIKISSDVWDVEVSVSHSPNTVRISGGTETVFGSSETGRVKMPTATIFVDSLFKRAYCNDQNPGVRIAHALATTEEYLRRATEVVPLPW
jgi:hypothetical protein